MMSDIAIQHCCTPSVAEPTMLDISIYYTRDAGRRSKPHSIYLLVP